MIMQVGHGTSDRLDQFGRVVLMKELLGADAVKELASLTKVRHEVDCERYGRGAGSDGV